MKQQVEQVLDPTLLLDAGAYDSITAEPLVHEPYIFYYAIDSIELNDSAAKAVQAFAQSKGLPVYVMFIGVLPRHGLLHQIREAVLCDTWQAQRQS